MKKESAMRRILRFLTGEPAPNPKLDEALKRAAKRVAAHREQQRQRSKSEPVGAS